MTGLTGLPLLLMLLLIAGLALCVASVLFSPEHRTYRRRMRHLSRKYPEASARDLRTMARGGRR